MKNQKHSLVNINETNISLTAYRALYVLSLLMERPYSRNELLEKLKNNAITSKAFSVDTLRVTINTLKYAGCIITRPTLRNHYTYILLYHPFCLDFTETEISVLNSIRNNILKTGNWKVVLDISEFYNRIITKTSNEKNITAIADAEPFKSINPGIIKFLSDPSVKNKEVILQYDSPNSGLNGIKVIVDSIFFQDGRLYLWCYSYKYENYSYLRLDKIKSINNIAQSECIIPKIVYEAEYVIIGDSMIGFRPIDYETVIEKTNDKIVVKANVLNEFNFMQRLLNFGLDFQVISPDSLRYSLISKLDLMLQGYNL